MTYVPTSLHQEYVQLGTLREWNLRAFWEFHEKKTLVGLNNLPVIEISRTRCH